MVMIMSTTTMMITNKVNENLKSFALPSAILVIFFVTRELMGSQSSK